jgi:hypothetical protein
MFVPWEPRYSREEAMEAIARSSSWADALRYLGLSPRGKNFTTIKKWALKWELDISHLPAYKPGRGAPSFSQQELRQAVSDSRSWAETARKMGRCPTGNGRLTIRKWVEEWGIDTSHFDPHAAAIEGLAKAARRAKPLADILVPNSSYSRYALKQRLYDEGLKLPICELCGQDETWNGMAISLILDHVNGVRNDNRLENLRIVCPNCAAGLETHCGRARRTLERTRECLRCGKSFRPKYRDNRYCSRTCGQRSTRGSTGPRPNRRKVERPPHDRLLREIRSLGWSAVGRKYGVSDNAIRGWIRAYERDRAPAEGTPSNVAGNATQAWAKEASDKRAA